MGKRIIIAAFFALNVLLGLNAQADSFQVIVNSKNPIDSLDKKFLADTFFKKITRWSDDSTIQPVDQKADAPVRREFSEDVLSRSVMGVKNYWQQLIFSGTDVPPPELGSDQEVIRYVSKNPGSVGYVSSLSRAGDKEPAGIKLVNVK